MKLGTTVKLRTYGEKEIVFKMVRREKNTLVVCSPEEYNLAQSQKREPKCVGFNIEYLLDECPD